MNQNPMRRQQEQMRKQQEQLRQRQMGAAWQAEQEAKAKQGQIAAPPTDDPYARLEALLRSLRQQYAAKQVSKEQAETQLRDNMIEDDQGAYWTMGFETGAWYRYVDGQWVKANPPRAKMPTLSAQPAATPTRKPRRFLGFIAFLFGCVLTAIAGTVMGWFAYNILDLRDPNDLIAASIVWGLGFILSIRWGNKVSRGT